MPNRYKNGRIPDKLTLPDRDRSRAGSKYNYNRKHSKLSSTMDLEVFSAQMTFNELAYLYDIPLKVARENKCIIANLGCFKGHSACFMALGMKHRAIEGKIYTVDLYGKVKQGSVNGNRPTAEARFRKQGVQNYIEICQGFTEEYSKTLSDLSFDFVFIDADHSYAHCRNDFDCWSPLVEAHGLIGFHDVHLNSVHKVTEEIQDKWELVDHYGLIKTFKRRKL